MSIFGRDLEAMKRNHWGLDGGDGVIFGGVHKERRSALDAKKRKIEAAKQANYQRRSGDTPKSEIRKRRAEAVKRWRDMPIKWIEEGDIYTYFGLGSRVTHGKNDGTHGSRAVYHLGELQKKNAAK